MNLRLAAIEATCRNQLASGESVPSLNLRVLAESAGLQSKTLEGLLSEAQRRLECAYRQAFT